MESARHCTTLRLSLLALVLLLVGAPAASAQRRIIGGSNVSITDHPYQVMVETQGVGDCGGSIRDANHVITAAHCVVNEDFFFPFIVAPADVLVGYGSSNVNSLTPIGVEQVSVHRGYLRDPSSSEFDVAVLTLDDSITLGPNAAPIAPATEGELTEGFEPANPANNPIPAFVTGWGLTEESGAQGSQFLKGVSLPLRPDEACIAEYGDVSRGGLYNSALMLCAGGQGTAPSGNPDTCQGDSGGPLVMDVDRSSVRTYKLIGVVGFGNGCGRESTPGAYAWVGAGAVFPFLYAPTPVAPPPNPASNPTISGTPRVGQALTCNAPPLADATIGSYLWSVFNPVDASFTLVAVLGGPNLVVPRSLQGALLVCDARYETEGGFSYSEAPADAAVGPVLPAVTVPVTPPVPADTARPRARIGRVRCRRGRCSVKIATSDVGGLVRSLSARLTYKVKRCRKVAGRRRCRSVKRTRRLRPRKTRGGFTITARLRPGQYTLSVVATDTSSNRSRTARKTFRVTRR